jgi:tryptophan-rich sensory protein
VTPLDAGFAKPLVGSLVHEVVCEEKDIEKYVPDPEGGLMGFDPAVRLAMRDATPDTGPRNLAVLGAATAASAIVGSLATQPSSRWYRSLDLPAWQPPKAAFPIVWTALYADIAATSAATLTSLEREGRHEEARAFRRALAANLALNSLWSVLFWRVRRLDVAAVEAALLAVSSADLARRAGDGSPVRGRLLAPYAAWTGFATVLTAAIARRNRR